MILDTNALSAWAEGHATIEAPLRSADRLVVPSVVLANTVSVSGNRVAAAAMRSGLPDIRPWSKIAAVASSTAVAYADIRLELKRLGAPIPPNDLWIAALARQHALSVLSDDNHFDVGGSVKRVAF